MLWGRRREGSFVNGPEASLTETTRGREIVGGATEKGIRESKRRFRGFGGGCTLFGEFGAEAVSEDEEEREGGGGGGGEWWDEVGDVVVMVRCRDWTYRRW